MPTRFYDFSSEINYSLPTYINVFGENGIEPTIDPWFSFYHPADSERSGSAQAPFTGSQAERNTPHIFPTSAGVGKALGISGASMQQGPEFDAWTDDNFPTNVGPYWSTRWFELRFTDVPAYTDIEYYGLAYLSGFLSGPSFGNRVYGLGGAWKESFNQTRVDAYSQEGTGELAFPLGAAGSVQWYEGFYFFRVLHESGTNRYRAKLWSISSPEPADYQVDQSGTDFGSEIGFTVYSRPIGAGGYQTSLLSYLLFASWGTDADVGSVPEVPAGYVAQVAPSVTTTVDNFGNVIVGNSNNSPVATQVKIIDTASSEVVVDTGFREDALRSYTVPTLPPAAYRTEVIHLDAFAQQSPTGSALFSVGLRQEPARRSGVLGSYGEIWSIVDQNDFPGSGYGISMDTSRGSNNQYRGGISFDRIYRRSAYVARFNGNNTIPGEPQASESSFRSADKYRLDARRFLDPDSDPVNLVVRIKDSPWVEYPDFSGTIDRTMFVWGLTGGIPNAQWNVDRSICFVAGGNGGQTPNWRAYAFVDGNNQRVDVDSGISCLAPATLEILLDGQTREAIWLINDTEITRTTFQSGDIVQAWDDIGYAAAAKVSKKLGYWYWAKGINFYEVVPKI